MTTKAARLALVAACAIVLVGCGGSSSSPSSSGTRSPSGASAGASSNVIPTPSSAVSAPPSSAPSSSPAASVAPSAAVVTDLTNIVSPQTAFRGAAGVFSWTDVVLKIAKPIIRWSATATATEDCTFSWKLSGKSTVSGTLSVAAGAKGSGNKTITGSTATQQLIVTNTCKNWLLTFNLR